MPVCQDKSWEEMSDDDHFEAIREHIDRMYVLNGTPREDRAPAILARYNAQRIRIAEERLNKLGRPE